MADALSDAFQGDLRCSTEAAEDLAHRARGYIARSLASTEDSDEDIMVRLQDPRILGAFAEVLLEGRDLPDGLLVALVERVFDLLPLPQTEGEVILVENQSPAALLSLAAFLADQDRFTVLHAMHLLYAVFLDRSLLTRAPRTTRAMVLERLLLLGEATEGLRLLYLALDLGSVPEPEAHGTLRDVLRSRGLPEAFKRSVATVASAEDGGRSALLRLAQQEGLMAEELEDSDAPGVLANLPRMPSRLAPVGLRWLRRHAKPPGQNG